jgi:chaperonin GroEL (HSP60 family)
LEETERSLQDAIMNVRRANKNDAVVPSTKRTIFEFHLVLIYFVLLKISLKSGGVAIEMELLKQHHEISNTNAGKELMHISAITQSAINIQPQSQLKKEWIHECEKIEEEKEEVKQQSIDDVIHQGFLDNTE